VAISVNNIRVNSLYRAHRAVVFAIAMLSCYIRHKLESSEAFSISNLMISKQQYIFKISQHFTKLRQELGIAVFSARQHICRARYATACPSVRLSVCLSVRPSVTLLDQSKTDEVGPIGS